MTSGTRRSWSGRSAPPKLTRGYVALVSLTHGSSTTRDWTRLPFARPEGLTRKKSGSPRMRLKDWLGRSITSGSLLFSFALNWPGRLAASIHAFGFAKTTILISGYPSSLPFVTSTRYWCSWTVARHRQQSGHGRRRKFAFRINSKCWRNGSGMRHCHLRFEKPLFVVSDKLIVP